MTRAALDRNEPSLYSMMLTAQLGHHLLPLSNWTLVAAGDALLTHLFKLFFTWDTTLTRLFHRRLLTEIIVYRQVAERPYENQLDAQFCSELLVNSILAYATVVSSRKSPVCTKSPTRHSDHVFHEIKYRHYFLSPSPR